METPNFRNMFLMQTTVVIVEMVFNFKMVVQRFIEENHQCYWMNTEKKWKRHFAIFTKETP